MSTLELFKSEKQKENTFCCDKVEYYWDSAMEVYCKSHNMKVSDLNPENMDENEESLIMEYAGNHIAFFLIWILRNHFCDEEMFEEEEIELLKDEKIDGTDFIMKYCDGKFYRMLMKTPILDFVDNYYMNKYFQDYSTFIENEIKGVVFGVRFSWEVYHKFSPVLDRAYVEYERKALD